MDRSFSPSIRAFEPSTSRRNTPNSPTNVACSSSFLLVNANKSDVSWSRWVRVFLKWDTSNESPRNDSISSSIALHSASRTYRTGLDR